MVARFDSPPRTTAHQDIPLSVPVVRDASRARTSARAAVVLDGATGALLYEDDALTPFPVASLMKLLSATVVLDRAPDLAREIRVLPSEQTIRGGNLRLGARETIALRDALVASILGSANDAAFALPRLLGMTDQAFAEEMNRKAITLGLETLHAEDAAGFSPQNVGSAYDIARLAAIVFQNHPLLAEAASMESKAVTVRAEGGSTREIVVRSSNPLRRRLPSGTESKTGYLHEALFTIVLTRRVGEARLVAAILGHPDEEGIVRDALALLEESAAKKVSSVSP